MPRRNGSEEVGGKPAAEFRRRAVTLRDDALELGHAGRRLAEDTIHRASRSAQDYYRSGRSRALAIEEAVEDYVRTYPIRSILFAAAAGYVFAKLWSRR